MPSKVTICHVPRGNPENAHTIRVGESAVSAHIAHGDYIGPCRDSWCPPWVYGADIPPAQILEPWNWITVRDLEGPIGWAGYDYFTRCTLHHPARDGVLLEDGTVYRPTPSDLARWGVQPDTYLVPQDVWATYTYYVQQVDSPPLALDPRIPQKTTDGQLTGASWGTTWWIVPWWAIDPQAEPWMTNYVGVSTLCPHQVEGCIHQNIDGQEYGCQCCPPGLEKYVTPKGQCFRPASVCEQFWARLAAQERFPDFVYTGPGHANHLRNRAYYEGTFPNVNPQGLPNSRYVIPEPPSFTALYERLTGGPLPASMSLDVFQHDTPSSSAGFEGAGLARAGLGLSFGDIFDPIKDAVDDVVDFVDDVISKVVDITTEQARTAVALAAQTAPMWAPFVPGGPAWAQAAVLADRAINGDKAAAQELDAMGLTARDVYNAVPKGEELERYKQMYQSGAVPKSGGGGGSNKGLLIAGGTAVAIAAAGYYSGAFKF